ncbi:MAG: DUF6169 family protein [Ferruginibacter sp.]
MAISLQPYNTSLLKPGYHYIITESDIEYVCFFAEFDYMFAGYPSIASKVFGFNIELLNKNDIKKQKGVDKRLVLTIVNLIKDFLSSKINAVVYVCDNTDERHTIRFKKFTNWFDGIDDGNYIQITGYVKAHGTEYYNAMLLHKDNKLKNTFIKAFQELNNQSPK